MESSHADDAALAPSGDGEEKTTSAVTVPAVLKYLDRDCERARIHSLVSLILSHDSGRALIEEVLGLVDKFSLYRLGSVIVDGCPSARSGESGTGDSCSPSSSQHSPSPRHQSPVSQ